MVVAVLTINATLGGAGHAGRAGGGGWPPCRRPEGRQVASCAWSMGPGDGVCPLWPW